MSEAVLAPGKRFRATLMLMTAEANGGVSAAVLDAAAAVEIVHAASLIIDDLPAMDNATLRRGRPSTHLAQGESRAILAGIALVAEGFRLLSNLPECDAGCRARAVTIMAEGIGHTGLCAGQELDLHAPKTMESVAREQDLKTGALFSAGFDIVAALHGMDTEGSAALSGLARQLGRVFQAYDDLRDVVGSGESLGKDQGLDSMFLRKGLLSVSRQADTLSYYHTLRNDLAAALNKLQFDSRNLSNYIFTVLPIHNG